MILSIKYPNSEFQIPNNEFRPSNYKGKAEEKLKLLQKIIQRGKASDAEIAEDFDVTIEYVQNLRKA
jgi:hypothetical protein